MTHLHPLSFFIDFIERRRLGTIRTEFFNEAYTSTTEVTHDFKDEWRTEFEMASGGLDGIPYKLYFKEYLTNVFDGERSLAIQHLDFQLTHEADTKRAHTALSVYASNLDVLISKIAKDPSYKRYPMILEGYKQLQEHLYMQAQSLGLMIGKSALKTNKKGTNFKLKWTDTLKTLTQLFHYLYYENRNNGEPFIVAKSKGDMVSFIHKNFVGKDGEPYEPGSIEDGLKPRSIRRRGKESDALDIDSIFKTKITKAPRGTR